MSRKSGRIAALIAGESAAWDPHYTGFFTCFNRQQFYEAHDVLEELWLAEGREGPRYAFYKGLIQLAGAFVHLQKDRLGPAVALFNLAEANLARYPARHQDLDLAATLGLIRLWRSRIEDSGRRVNPLPLHPAPRLELTPDPAPGSPTSG